MIANRRSFLLGTAAIAGCWAAGSAQAASLDIVVDVGTPMNAPTWALLQREVLRTNTEACEAFFARYYDERGYLRDFVHYHKTGAGLDGADDAIENVNDWPFLHALGAPEIVRQMYEKAYEGHLRQYTEAKSLSDGAPDVGMYYKEFPGCVDWEHIGEGLSVFNVMGLSDPYDHNYRDRVRRFAGFYMNEDPGAPNYDPKYKIVRSLMNGSRGPMLRKATPQDWAGDPVDPKYRFLTMHGEDSYEQMLAHLKEYTDVVGDHPLNLECTILGLNAYMLAQEPKYKNWMLDYIDAWVERARENNNILPSNIGLDGKIGGEGTDGKWYGGCYGWAFSPVVPMTGKRANRNLVIRSIIAFLSAYMLTGDDKYLDVWRKMADKIDEPKKLVGGTVSTPRMYDDQGWYGYVPGLYTIGSRDIYYLSMMPSDRARAPDHPWLLYLEGKNPNYPETALRTALDDIRNRGDKLRVDTTSPDTRVADSFMNQNPANVNALIELMLGGIHIGARPWSDTTPVSGGSPLFCRLRYFDPEAKRAGLPEDTAALVDHLSADSTGVTLVNLDLTSPRLVTVQGGAYGEHQIVSVSDGHTTQPVNAAFFKVRLAPGAGARLTLNMKRFANPPTLNFPWDSAITGQELRNIATDSAIFRAESKEDLQRILKSSNYNTVVQ